MPGRKEEARQDGPTRPSRGFFVGGNDRLSRRLLTSGCHEPLRCSERAGFRSGYLWITLAFFVISIVGQWLFGWFAYVNEQTDLKAPIELSDYSFRMLRDTLENWQSEFLQLIWQVAGFAEGGETGCHPSSGRQRGQEDHRCSRSQVSSRLAKLPVPMRIEHTQNLIRKEPPHG